MKKRGLINKRGRMKSKKAVSEMVGYVLLIVIAISVSILVYAFLSSLPWIKPEACPDDTSLMIEDYSCYGKIFNLTVKNNGLHSLDGFYIHISNDTKKPVYALGEIGDIEGMAGEVFFKYRLNSSKSKEIRFDFTRYNNITRVEIKPFRSVKTRVACESAIITQDIIGC